MKKQNIKISNIEEIKISNIKESEQIKNPDKIFYQELLMEQREQM
jgi:hypothetical protein